MDIEVVETVIAPSLEALRRARDLAVGDLVELRLDHLTAADVAGALDGRRRPVVVTCRPTWEGGAFTGSEEERFRVLREAVRLGAEYVDVEWAADRASFTAGERTRLILSNHDFSGVPADLAQRVAAMRGERPHVVKVAVTPTRLTDCLVLRNTLGDGDRHVAIAMGSMGQVTRVCPWLFGSCWTYGGSAAPGQIPAADLISTYRVPAGSMETTIYAVAGSPIAHSASPAMHNAALAACGIDATYLALETTDADELLIVARALGVAGLSVTAPLKTGVFARASRTDELSQRVGASNTLRFDHGDWEARNFDVAGFLAPLLRREVPLADARAVVLGAGGAARTAVWALLAEGARVEVAARRIDRAAALAEEFGVAAVNWPPRPGWNLLVNTTPVGTWPAVEESPIDRADVQGDCVYDLIYNPEETALLTWAKEGGARTIGGLEMLVAQAARQFTWWTGREAPLTTIEAAARRFVAHVTGRSS